jgi:serine/threonine protein kinase
MNDKKAKLKHSFAQNINLKEVCSACRAPVSECCCSVDEVYELEEAVPTDEQENAPDGNIGVTIGQYTIQSKIGDGGMGAVYRATHSALDKTLAVKILRSDYWFNAVQLKRFTLEAKAASQLSHPNLAAIYDYGVTDRGAPFLVMDYLSGGSLAELIEHEGFLEPLRALDIFIQLSDALVHAHAKKIVHRDLKPTNVILSSSDKGKDFVKIVDFGIAKVLPGNEKEANKLTQTGEIIGSPLYMSPEQCLGKRLDERSDIYSLGCLMYETLAGQAPFVGPNPIQTIFKHVNEQAPRLSQTAPDLVLPFGLEYVVLKCLEKDPQDRFQSMEEVKVALEKIRDGERPAVKKLRRELTTTQSRARILTVIAAVFLLPVFIVAGMSMQLLNRPKWATDLEKAHIALSKRDSQIALEHLDKALKEADGAHAGNATKMEIFNTRGDCYYSLARAENNSSALFWEAIKNYYEASKFAGTALDQGNLSERIGECYYNIKDFKDAKNYYETAARNRTLEPGPANVYRAENDLKLGMALQQLGNYDQALAKFMSAIDTYKSIPEQRPYLANAYNQAGLMLEKQNKLKEAANYFLAAKAIRKQTNDSVELTRVENNLARVQKALQSQ